MLFSDGDRIVFTGDSVTDVGRGRPVGEGIHAGTGNGYVRIIETILNVFYPEMNIRVSNTGSSGDNILSLSNRWEQDVLNLKPDWISVCIGINDVWRQFDSPSVTDLHVYPDVYEKTLNELIERSLPKVKGMILATPYYIENLKDDPMRKRMDEYSAIVKKTAEKHPDKIIFVDLQSAFDDYLNYRHSSFIAWDRVHPNQVGSLIMARAILEASGINISVQ